MVSTHEIRVDRPEERKFDVVRAPTEEFKKTHKVIDIDGARVLFRAWLGIGASFEHAARYCDKV
jgi:hypothetical protein